MATFSDQKGCKPLHLGIKPFPSLDIHIAVSQFCYQPSHCAALMCFYFALMLPFPGKNAPALTFQGAQCPLGYVWQNWSDWLHLNLIKTFGKYHVRTIDKYSA